MEMIIKMITRKEVNYILFGIIITIGIVIIGYFLDQLRISRVVDRHDRNLEKIKNAQVEYKIWEPNSTMLEGWFMDWDTGNLPYEASGSKIVRESCTAWKFHKFDVKWNIGKYCKKIHIER